MNSAKSKAQQQYKISPVAYSFKFFATTTTTTGAGRQNLPRYFSQFKEKNIYIGVKRVKLQQLVYDTPLALG